MDLESALNGSVLAVRDGQTVYEACSGLADRERGTPITRRTRFQLASVSKQFTAAAILLQVERGTVRLDHEVSRWIEGCPPSWHGITVHHLLTHTSGLGHWEDYPDVDLTEWAPPADVVKAFQQAGPLFEVGTDWAYSSPAYVLLAHIVEHASGRPYREFLTTEIFEPLDLRDTFAGAAGDRSDCAVGYGDDGSAVPLFELDAVGMGAGDLSSTAVDMVRWDQALAAGEFLSDESRRSMFTRHAKLSAEHATDPDDTYGYGWAIGRVADRPAIYHSGDNAGFRTFNTWFPELDTFIVVLTNEDSADSHELSVRIAKHVLD